MIVGCLCGLVVLFLFWIYVVFVLWFSCALFVGLLAWVVLLLFGDFDFGLLFGGFWFPCLMVGLGLTVFGLYLVLPACYVLFVGWYNTG